MEIDVMVFILSFHYQIAKIYIKFQIMKYFIVFFEY